MSAPDRSTISQFVHLYKGIEEFYFLNRDGDLGYIKSGEMRSVKETFPQLRDRAFLKSNPDFLPELEEFLRELGRISSACLENPPCDLELGYVLPAGDQYQWRTSTLVLHKHVLETLQADYEAMIENGTREQLETERILNRIGGIWSIHRGLDELTNHKDVFDQYRYFPALFVLPERDAGVPHSTRSHLRVINLRWRDKGLDSHQYGPADPSRARELVFHILRNNLTQRGAIDRSQRVVEPLLFVA